MYLTNGILSVQFCCCAFGGDIGHFSNVELIVGLSFQCSPVVMVW